MPRLGRRRVWLWVELLIAVALVATPFVAAYRAQLRANLAPQLVDAIVKGNVKLAAGLLDAGADPNAWLRQRPPLSYRQALMSVFQSHREEDDDIPEGPTCLELSLVKYRVGKGWSSDGTPNPNCDKLVSLLLDHGARIVKQGPFDDDPFYDACVFRQWKAAEMMLNRGASANTSGDDGPPLLIAIQDGDFAAASMLLRHGANPNILDDFNLSPVSYAIEAENRPLLEDLLQHGANPNKKCAGPSGLVSPLAYAKSLDSKPEILQTLIRAGAH